MASYFGAALSCSDMKQRCLRDYEYDQARAFAAFQHKSTVGEAFPILRSPSVPPPGSASASNPQDGLVPSPVRALSMDDSGMTDPPQARVAAPGGPESLLAGAPVLFRQRHPAAMDTHARAGALEARVLAVATAATTAANQSVCASDHSSSNGNSTSSSVAPWQQLCCRSNRSSHHVRGADSGGGDGQASDMAKALGSGVKLTLPSATPDPHEAAAVLGQTLDRSEWWHRRRRLLEAERIAEETRGRSTRDDEFRRQLDEALARTQALREATLAASAANGLGATPRALSLRAAEELGAAPAMVTPAAFATSASQRASSNSATAGSGQRAGAAVNRAAAVAAVTAGAWSNKSPAAVLATAVTQAGGAEAALGFGAGGNAARPGPGRRSGSSSTVGGAAAQAGVPATALDTPYLPSPARAVRSEEERRRIADAVQLVDTTQDAARARLHAAINGADVPPLSLECRLTAPCAPAPFEVAPVRVTSTGVLDVPSSAPAPAYSASPAASHRRGQRSQNRALSVGRTFDASKTVVTTSELSNNTTASPHAAAATGAKSVTTPPVCTPIFVTAQGVASTADALLQLNQALPPLASALGSTSPMALRAVTDGSILAAVEEDELVVSNGGAIARKQWSSAAAAPHAAGMAHPSDHAGPSTFASASFLARASPPCPTLARTPPPGARRSGMLVDLDVAAPPQRQPPLPVRSFRLCGSVPVDTTGSVRPLLVADTPRGGGASQSASLSGRAAFLAAAAPRSAGATHDAYDVAAPGSSHGGACGAAAASTRRVSTAHSVLKRGGGGAGDAATADDEAVRLRAFYAVNAGGDGSAALERQLRLREVLAAEAQVQQGIRMRASQAERLSQRWDNIKAARTRDH